MTVPQFTTIGHSNRSLDEFLAMLRDAHVDLLADVRSFPRSRTNPFFNIDSLPDGLARVQIGYRHCPALGGRRRKQSGVDENLNAMWRVSAMFSSGLPLTRKCQPAHRLRSRTLAV